MKPPPVELLKVLREARALVARPGNDFSRSGWRDEADALRELDALIQAVRERRHGARGGVSTLFLPTGALQELSLSSGWGEAYLALAERCERALPELSPD